MLIKFYKAHTAFNPVNSLTLPWLTDSPLPSSVSCDTIFMIIDEISFVSWPSYADWQYYQKAEFNNPISLHCSNAQKSVFTNTSIIRITLLRNKFAEFQKSKSKFKKLIHSTTLLGFYPNKPHPHFVNEKKNVLIVCRVSESLPSYFPLWLEEIDCSPLEYIPSQRISYKLQSALYWIFYSRYFFWSIIIAFCCSIAVDIFFFCNIL